MAEPEAVVGEDIMAFDEELIEVHYALPNDAGCIMVSYSPPQDQTTAPAVPYVEAMMQAARQIDSP